jgi:hypothetical protein
MTLKEIERDFKSGIFFHEGTKLQLERRCSLLYSDFSSVADPDPNPNPDFLGPPGSGSGSFSQRYGSGSGSGSGSLYHQAKIVRKTLIPAV